MKKVTIKLGTALAKTVLKITTLNANSTCLFTAHQPRLPHNAKKLRKF